MVRNIFGTRDGFPGRQFFHGSGAGSGEWFQDDWAHYIYCALHYYYISATSEHQALDPGVGNP